MQPLVTLDFLDFASILAFVIALISVIISADPTQPKGARIGLAVMGVALVALAIALPLSRGA